MTGYIGKCKQLGGRTVWGLFLMVLLGPIQAPAKTQLPSATDRPRKTEARARKKYLPERTLFS